MITISDTSLHKPLFGIPKPYLDKLQGCGVRLDALAARANEINKNKIISYSYVSMQQQPQTNDAALFPIEYFRWHAPHFFTGGRCSTRFVSSGTTREHRAQSLFSSHGLELYRTSALAGFCWMLANVWPGEDPSRVRGISLIPTVKEWPDSSLSMMLKWLGELFPTRFCPADIGALRQNLAEIGRDEPVWIFATALHWWQLVEGGQITPLSQWPVRVMLIETGGTKGAEQAFTRAALYQRLKTQLGIESPTIVSEYGMSELASQAYDWVQHADIDERSFSFPPWVKPLVCRRVSEIRESGSGALVVDDALRCDYPWPIRTQDLASLNVDGSFQLLGRIAHAPLKGCSLQVSGTHDQQDARVGACSNHRLPEMIDLDWDKLATRAKMLARHRLDFLNSSALFNAWQKEFSCPVTAKWAVEDLKASWPETPEALEAMARASVAGRNKVECTWLLILPENHSMAGFYPIICGALLGLNLQVRLPQKFAAQDSPIQQLLFWLNQHVAGCISTLPSSWRLDANAENCFDALLAYGSDETLARLRSMTERRAKCFGSKVALSVVSYGTPPNYRALIRDSFSLRQRGCLNTRLCLISGDIDQPTFCQQLHQSFIDSQLEISADEEVGLDGEALRYRDLENQVTLFWPVGGPLMACCELPRDAKQPLSWILQNMVSRYPFALPMVWAGETDINNMLKSIEYLGPGTPAFQIVTENHENFPMCADSRTPVVAPGTTNTPPWDGQYEAKPLFG